MIPRSTARLCCLLTVIILIAGAVQSNAQDHKQPLSRLDLKDGDTVVFLGDSITHQCLYTQYVEDFYYTRFPKLRVRFHNAGVGGARARDALDRFDRDIAAYKPTYVTVLLGMNDGTYQPYDDPTFQTYRADMTELIKRIRDIGAMPILMTPTMFDSRAARLRAANPPPPAGRLELYNATLAYYGAWLREVAVESGAGFVDMYSPLNNLTVAARKSDPTFTLIKDAVHPDPPGQVVMAVALLSDLDSPAVVSSIELDSSGPAVKPTGGRIEELRGDGKGVEFVWHADQLPWVLPKEAEIGVRLTYAGHRLGRELLEVSGLAAGTYELRIDGEPVGRYSATELARGIALEANDQTPQYKQALDVATRNKTRNEGPVRSLRNEWSQMQQFYRLQRAVKADPNNAEAARNLEAQTKKVEGLEQRVAEHEKNARLIETEIIQASQPKPHKYKLTRL